MKSIQLKNGFYLRIVILSAYTTLSACGLPEVLQSYQHVSLVPQEVATFASFELSTCPDFFSRDRSAIPPADRPRPAQFSGIGDAAVGYSGSFVVRTGHQIDTMQTAIKFDFAGASIPPQSVNETMIANLVFIYHLTPRSELDSRCQPSISGTEIATMAWDSTADFGEALASTRFTTVPCERITGSRVEGAFRCLVSTAVVDWISDPAAHPNNGFVIVPPDRTFNSCSTNLGELGDRFECVTELTSIGLNLQYLPP